MGVGNKDQDWGGGGEEQEILPKAWLVKREKFLGGGSVTHQCQWHGRAPRHATSRVLTGEEQRSTARQPKHQLVVNHPLTQAWTEAIRALLCGTLSA